MGNTGALRRSVWALLGHSEEQCGQCQGFQGAAWAVPWLSGEQCGHCWGSQKSNVSTAGVLAPALGCLNSWQAELLRGRCHGQLHLMCRSYLAHGGCSFPLIFGGIDL